MNIVESTTTLLELIPHEAAIIDLGQKMIVQVNRYFEKSFGICVGAPVEDLNVLFVVTPTLKDADETITTELRQQRATMWPQFSMHTVNNGICNYDLHIAYVDAAKTAVHLIFASSSHDIEQMELQNGYYETISASSFSYPFYLNVKTKRMEFFGPIMEQFKLPDMMENFPEPVLAGGMILEEDLPDYLAMVERMYKGEPPTGFFRSYTPTGEILGYTVNYTVKYDEDGQPDEIIGDFINKQPDMPDEVSTKRPDADETRPVDGKNTVLVHQIKAHFFFNTLNTISALCKQDANKADKAIQTFATERVDDVIQIVIEDDGRGFDTAILKDSKSIGLKNMAERVKLMVDGSVTIESTRGKGTRAVIEIPAQAS